MTNVLIRDLSDRYLTNCLPSKHNFDNVKLIETTKPEIGVPGFVNLEDSMRESSHNGVCDNPIIAKTSNFHKERGVFVSEEGYIKLPRSLIQSGSWRDLRMKQQKFFLYILQRVQFTTLVTKHNGIEFIVMPGQLCISYRNLVQDYNSTVKYKDEKIDLSFLQRAVSAFLANGWADTRTDTGITVITITQPDLYDHFKSLSDTRTDTETIQRRYNNEERKKEKERKETINDVGSPLSKKDKKEEKNLAYFPPASVFDEPLSEQMKQSSEEQFKQDFVVVCAYVADNNIPLKEDELERWIRKWGSYTVISNIDLMKKQKKRVDKPGGWMEKALKEDWAKLKKNIPINRKFAEEFKKNKNWSDLKILQNYCTILGCGYDLPLNFDPETFQYTLSEKFQNLTRSSSTEENY